MKNNYSLYPGRNREIIDFEEIDIQKPEITFVTAYYNGVKYIDETINSVLNQTFQAWEWIIVNDGPTDEKSLEKLNEIAKYGGKVLFVGT